jgi:hypothetical protein
MIERGAPSSSASSLARSPGFRLTGRLAGQLQLRDLEVRGDALTLCGEPVEARRRLQRHPLRVGERAGLPGEIRQPALGCALPGLGAQLLVARKRLPLRALGRLKVREEVVLGGATLEQRRANLERLSVRIVKGPYFYA